MAAVGKEGVITVQDGKTLEDELEVIEGMKFDRGYLSPYFVTDPKTSKCDLDDALILIVDKKISTFNQIHNILSEVVRTSRPLLIIAEDIENEALATLILNKIRGNFKVCGVKAPGFSDRTDILNDIAALTGARVVSDDVGLTLENVTLDDLGSAKKIAITKDDTLILDGAGDREAILQRCEILRQQIDESKSSYDREKREERLAKLTGGVAVIKCGGASETEVGEKKDRVTDALNATSAAVEAGIIPGGGVALLRASKSLKSIRSKSLDYKVGVDIVREACLTPARTIAENAGCEGQVIINKLLNMRDDRRGFDARNEKFVDMLEAGIIDPTKVVKSALISSSHTASLMLTAEAAVVELPKEQPEPPAPGGMGGMGGMGGGMF